jgi:flagellar motor switch protein FliN/FliY
MATVPASTFTPHSLPGPSPAAALTEQAEVFASAFCEGAGSALTTVLNRRVAVELGALAPLAAPAVAAMVPAVVVTLAWQRGFSGGHWFMLPAPAAMRLARALAGDDEEGVELETADLEAIRDAVNQVLTAACPALLPLLGRSVAYAPVTVRFIGTVDALPAELTRDGEGWLGEARLVGSGLDLPLAFTIPSGVARDMAATAGLAEPTPLAPSPRGEAPPARLDLILDVSLPVTVELGRSRMQIQEILKLAPGSVIELDKSAGDPVELYINDRPIARGEVVIIDENFGVRLTSIVTATERIKTLR